MKMKHSGFLFSLLNLYGSRSEGPIFFLQPFSDGSENPIEKIAGRAIPIKRQQEPWESERRLDPYLGKKVMIYGEILESGELVYEEVFPLQTQTTNERDTITKAYEAKVAQLFNVLFDSCLIAQSDEEKQKAEKKFHDSVHHAKQILERAIFLLA